ncbi:aminotransferase class I/II-fold pyridoxal phosphate-dependent enzyme [Dyella monticola]|uniref:Aminotransferase class I/II-fold pyridoxal phosphate-dependent enzyme n=1 Tax=Dyella monticola TaxID=1927958 RepID=A0A370X545_9GAMM|nr:aminotransferase class I/II-fold pyridoxal phosphate-dependent enzyme [Dyella monticola]RDS83549.1 aminotransferase class I/II-fold pyridoxal phosphate-dependent enzyme [Dyella monticola]
MSSRSEVSRRVISDKYRPVYEGDMPAILEGLSGGLSGTSDIVTEYEQALAAWFNSRHAVAVSSGAAAISVALGALGVKPGDEVVLTPTCPLCTVYPVMSAGAKPVFVDTRPHGFGVDLTDLAKVITPRTKAIIDIPMWGYPTEVDELQAVARGRSIPLILDLAHSHGSKLHGKHLSHYADLSCFSTHERKPLATGEGGFILADNLDLADRCRSYSRFGNLNGKDFGLNYKLAALSACLGRSRLEHLERQIEARRRNAHHLVSRITHPKVSEKQIIADSSPNYYFLNLSLSFRDNRKFIDYLDENGIPSDIKRYGCRCLYEFPTVAVYARKCPNGERLLNSMTTIPIHPDLKEDDLGYIVELINDYSED